MEKELVASESVRALRDRAIFRVLFFVLQVALTERTIAHLGSSGDEGA